MSNTKHLPVHIKKGVEHIDHSREQNAGVRKLERANSIYWTRVSGVDLVVVHPIDIHLVLLVTLVALVALRLYWFLKHFSPKKMNCSGYRLVILNALSCSSKEKHCHSSGARRSSPELQEEWQKPPVWLLCAETRTLPVHLRPLCVSAMPLLGALRLKRGTSSMAIAPGRDG